MPIYTKTWVSDDGCVELTLTPPEEGSQFCLTLRVENEDTEFAEATEIILATDHGELDEIIVLLQTIRSAPIPDSHEEDPALSTNDDETDDEDEPDSEDDEDGEDEPENETT